jgi:hypothetical protein
VDDALQNDPAATAGLQAAQAMANPDFSGAGSFSIDFGQAPGVFEGALQAGRLSSENPVLTTQPVTWTLSLALFPGAAPIALTLHGAHLQFQTGTDAASGAPGLLAGQINGSISNADVQTKVIPGVAQSLTSYVQQHPGTPDTMTIEGIFDTGGCTDANGVMAKPNDLMITTCEIAGNLLITNVLSPDVQIFDAQGNYAPNKTNTMKDSFSVGVGFLAVQASW